MMKKIYCVFALAAVVATAACNKDNDNSNPSKDELVGGNINDWLSDGLYGSPKKVEGTRYRNVKFDTLTMKAIAPTAADIDEVYTVEYNGAGYRTAYEYTGKVIAGVKSYNANSGYIKVTTEMRTSSKRRYDYDSNRKTLDEYMIYNYYARYGSSSLYSYNIQGDSTYVGYGHESSQFTLSVDTSSSYKYETTYDDGAKTATQTYYRYTGGAWKELNKTVYKLNAYGYIDDNATYQQYAVKPTAVEYEEKPSYTGYKEADDRGNWTLYYYYYPWNSVSNYTTRDITYY